MSRNFWTLMASQLINRFGDGFYTIPLAWVVFNVTGSPLAVGALVFVRLVVMTSVQFIASPLVDLHDRRRLMIWLDLLRAAVSASPFWLIGSGHFAVWQLYAVVFVYGALSTPYRSSSGALLPTLVPASALASANAWLQGGMQSMYVVGPTIAGIFVAHYGARPSFLIDAVTFVLSAAILSRLRQPYRQAAAADPVKPRALYLEQIRAGLRTIARSRLLVTLTLLQSMLLFADSAFMLAIPYVREVLHGSATAVGLLEGSLSLGMIGVSAVSAHGIWTRRPLLVLLSVPMFCLASAALGWTDQLGTAVLLQAVAGLGYGLFMVRSVLLIQRLVPNDLLGRTLMLRAALSVGTQAIGVALAGAVAQLVSVPVAFEAVGLCSGVVAAAVVLRAARHGLTRTASV